MKKIISILAIVLLAGCAVGGTPVVTSEQIKVPVPVACTVQYPTKPQNLLANLKTTDSVLTKGNAVIAELKLYQIYSTELEAALSQCADPANVQTTQPQSK